MTTEERESRLTAYALNDPGLSPAARREIETQLASDPAARRAVEEMRQIGQLLTAGLAAEQAATRTESVVTIPAEKSKSAKPAWWAKHAVADIEGAANRDSPAVHHQPAPVRELHQHRVASGLDGALAGAEVGAREANAPGTDLEATEELDVEHEWKLCVWQS